MSPEGTVTKEPDRWPMRGKTGIARLALQCGAPVLPVAMVGTREAQPIGQVLPRLFMPITVRFSRPMTFERFYERAEDPRVLREITDTIMFELRELSGQEYVNSYAKRKAEQADDPRTTVGLLAGSMIARGWIAAGIIFGVGLATTDEAGLSGALLFIVTFTISFTMGLILRPFEEAGR
jgi:hypothetical protein